ncbi:T9SS type A sorting domain-containing protein [Microvirga sp. STS02]|uniref:T9SS type A sorting domain-containing protein n=1 Tax=Hymenobacter negativus TaxID=2795026 RepID=UPI0018DC8E26|nr:MULTISPECIES: T9SS type A sorting domain-containing protein [Bacteria]MBH8569895.1 T9SS type A sorting domain-containing protein [Hymenobacter negativus]MBR7209634.1 T9SS type A sorting domain-containing protein [Microvirga sp. STS02]
MTLLSAPFSSLRFATRSVARVGLGLVATVAGLAASAPVQAQQLSFPGVEGAGRFVSGGRGRAATPTTVYEVTSLADTNTQGTLRYALSQSSSVAQYRTIVFRVCGTIHLTARLSIPRNTTIAGQTAPGDGICLADRQVTVSGDNVIVRFVRFRLGDQYQKLVDANGNPLNGSGDDDAFSMQERKNIVIDHCTMSWSDDEAFTFYGAATDSMTLQWNLISEPLNYSYHFETGDTDYERHGYGGIWGGRRASFHHNLFAHCNSRTPRWNGTRYGAAIGSENCDFRNNVIYDWGSNNVYGGEGGNYNMVNNYYKPGPATSSGSRSKVVNPYKQTTAPLLPYAQIYLAGNYLDGNAAVTNANWKGATMQGGTLADTVQSKALTPFNIAPLNTQTAQAAYTSVLQGVGCILPVRDALDQRIINDVQNRTGGIIDVQGGFPHGTPYSTSQVAWPVLTCGPAPADSDHDGMTDAYEAANGLNPNNAADRQTIAANGYTNLENYLNGLVATVTATKPTGAVLEPLHLFPNPAAEQLTVEHPRSGAEARLTIYNFVGQRVATLTPAVGGVSTPVSLGNLAKGNYLLVYTDANVSLTAKCAHE